MMWLLANQGGYFLHPSILEKIVGISFCLFVILLASLVMKISWNRLAGMMEWTGRVRYRQALVWGLLACVPALGLMLIVQGLHQTGAEGIVSIPQLMSSNPEDSRIDIEASKRGAEEYWKQVIEERISRLEEIRIPLLKYAVSHEGRYPESIRESSISDVSWRLPSALGGEYEYVSGQKYEESQQPLVMEPDLGGRERFMLTVGGEVQVVPVVEVEKRQ